MDAVPGQIQMVDFYIIFSVLLSTLMGIQLRGYRIFENGTPPISLASYSGRNTPWRYTICTAIGRAGNKSHA